MSKTNTKRLLESLHKVNEKIVKVGSKWQVQSEDGQKVLGSYDTKEAAEQRLKQIEYFKHKNESANAYEYKKYVIIQSPSGWKIKKDDEFLDGEYATDKEAEEYIDSLNETYDDVDPRPNESRLWGAVEHGELDARHVLDDLLRFLDDNLIGDFIQSEYENLLEAKKTNEMALNEMPRLPHLTQKIIDELDRKAKLLAKRKAGSDIVDYVSVTSGPAGVEFRAELEYEDMDEIAEELNKILERHGFHTYFEADVPGFWTAYIDPQFID